MPRFHRTVFLTCLAIAIFSGCNEQKTSTAPSASTFGTDVAINGHATTSLGDDNDPAKVGTPGTTVNAAPHQSGDTGKETKSDVDLPVVPLIIVAPEPEPPFEVKHEAVDFIVDGTKVIGTLALPVGKSPAPVVLLLHGYTGSCSNDDVAGTGEKLFGRVQRLWAVQGYASLCIDYRGSGRSQTTAFPWANTTFETQIADAAKAVSFLESDKRVNGKRIAAVGWSQGGLIAAGLAGRTPDLQAVGLWNAVTTPPETYAGIFGANNLRAGLTTGERLRNGLKQGFFEGVYSTDPVTEIAKYHGPLFVSAGTADTVVAPQPYLGNLLLKYHEGEEEMWIRPMDHSFETTKSAKLFDEMLAATLTFLRKRFDKKD